MIVLFDNDFKINKFEALKIKAKGFLEEQLKKQHGVATNSLDNYRGFKSNTASLNELPYYILGSHQYKYLHSINVSKNCVRLAEIEGNTSVQVMELVGLLHDVSYFGCEYKKHGTKSGNITAEFLSKESDLREDDIAKISRIVSSHYPEDDTLECYCCKENISLEEVLLVEADFLEKVNLKSGIQVLLECGNRKFDLQTSLKQFEARIIEKSNEYIACSNRKGYCSCTDSFFQLVEEQLECTKKFIDDLRMYL